LGSYADHEEPDYLLARVRPYSVRLKSVGGRNLTGRSIRIFLAEGSTSGLRTAELGLSTIKALAVPRTSLAAAAARSELGKTGLYVLLGDDPDSPGTKLIYIGEGDTVLTRISSHNKDPEKDFWDECVVFVSKDSNLTKAHVRYVEARLIQIARDVKRARVLNGTLPSPENWLPEPDEVEMEEFIAQTQLLLGSFGYNIFEAQRSFSVPIPSSDTSADSASSRLAETLPPEFEFSGNGFFATCIIDPDTGRYVVKCGSTARKEEAPALQQTYRTSRQQLMDNGVLRSESDDVLSFTQDYSFKSPTAAAQVVAGYPINGRDAWKSRVDQTPISKWLEKQLPSETGV
jgi:hypothetical protein